MYLLSVRIGMFFPGHGLDEEFAPDSGLCPHDAAHERGQHPVENFFQVEREEDIWQGGRADGHDDGVVARTGLGSLCA